MPGLIVSVSASEGQTVDKGDRLFTIEAMKMETAVYAQAAATVTEVAAAAGARVEVQDLVLVLELEPEPA